MRNKLGYHFRFICVFSILLSLALISSYILKEFYQISAGFGLQAAAFFLAFYIARLTHRSYLEHLISRSGRVLVDRLIFSVLVISAVSAALAFGLDLLIVPITGYLDIASFDWTGAGRLFALSAVYFVIAYIITERVAQKMIKQGRYALAVESIDEPFETHTPEMTDEQNQQITELLTDLPDPKRMTLLKGAMEPGAPMVTFKGSPNDQLWAALSKYGWTKSIRLKRNVKKQLSATGSRKKLSGWAVTPKGAQALASMHIEKQSQALRLVNG